MSSIFLVAATGASSDGTSATWSRSARTDSFQVNWSEGSFFLFLDTKIMSSRLVGTVPSALSTSSGSSSFDGAGALIGVTSVARAGIRLMFLATRITSRRSFVASVCSPAKLVSWSMTSLTRELTLSARLATVAVLRSTLSWLSLTAWVNAWMWSETTLNSSMNVDTTRLLGIFQARTVAAKSASLTLSLVTDMSASVLIERLSSRFGILYCPYSPTR